MAFVKGDPLDLISNIEKDYVPVKKSLNFKALSTDKDIEMKTNTPSPRSERLARRCKRNYNTHS
jgi:hypothetical protein